MQKNRNSTDPGDPKPETDEDFRAFRRFQNGGMLVFTALQRIRIRKHRACVLSSDFLLSAF